MDENTTVDQKPSSLRLVEARPRTRSTRTQVTQPAPTQTDLSFSGGYGYPPPYPYWGLPGYQGGNGTFYPPGPAPSPNPSASNDHDIEIISWLSYLDRHERRNKDGLWFSTYGPTLKDKGFIRVSQLVCKYVEPSVLQECLDINIGTAILIMQYAAQDLEAVRSGRLVLPSQL